MKPKGKTLMEVFAAEDSTMTKTEMQKAFIEMAALSRGKHKGMNKTEKEFSWILEAQRREGKILRWRYEAVKVRVGDGCFYVPDFFVERDNQKPLFIEIKGFMRDDARVKFLASKELHEWAEWQMWRKQKHGWKQIL